MTTQQLARDVKFLKAYALVATLLPATALLFAFSKPDKPVRFGEITVERLESYFNDTLVVHLKGQATTLTSSTHRTPELRRWLLGS
ncbi:hypothetical protein [Hymenobacter sp. BT730]|uniref:hypothetical protein n=1 Tax=Hymenobacter sp. BT730 TaxID=3063332 RepID=UPI0026E05F05|nr:hypothetical protein [Hymenobacter sp. BT730]